MRPVLLRLCGKDSDDLKLDLLLAVAPVWGGEDGRLLCGKAPFAPVVLTRGVPGAPVGRAELKPAQPLLMPRAVLQKQRSSCLASNRGVFVANRKLRL